MKVTHHQHPKGFGFSIEFDRAEPPAEPDAADLLRDAVREIIAWRTGANTFAKVFGGEGLSPESFLCHIPSCQAALARGAA